MIEDQVAAEQFRLGRSMLQLCIILLVCLAMLAPPLPSGGAFPFLKMEEVLVPIFGLLYTWLLMIGAVPVFRLNGMFIIGIVFTFCVLLSTWYGAVALEQSVVLRDFYEIPKLWFPVAFFTMSYEANLGERGVRRLFCAYGFATLLVCFYAWGQWRGLPLTQALNGYYSGGIHDQALFLTRRVYSTMGNPNVLGQSLSWAVVCVTLALLAKVGNRLWSALIILSSVITIAMTSSRYALLATAGGIAMVLVLTLSGFSSFHHKRAVQLGLLLFLLPIVGFFAFQVVQSNPHAVSRYQDLKHPEQVDSLRQRFDDLWLGAAADFARSPVVGFGPAKTRFSGIITDSEYLDVLKQFGIVGFGAYISFFLYPLSLLWKGMRMIQRIPPTLEPQLRANVLAVRCTFVMLLTALLMNVGASTFYNLFLQGFLWLWLGVGARSARTVCEAAEIVPMFSGSALGLPSFFERPAHDA